MRIRTEQLSHQLQKNLSPIYLLSGDVPLLMQETIEQIRTTARANAYHERESYQVDTQFDWQALLHNMQARSLFSERRLVELHIPNGNPGQHGSKCLQDYVKHISADVLLLMTCPKLDSKALQSAWIKAIDDHGVIVQIWPVPLTQMSQWLKQRMQVHGLTATTEALEAFAELIEGNLFAAAQEIMKMELLFSAEKRTLDVNDIVHAVVDHTRHDVFQLTEAILIGDQKRTHKILQALREQGIEAAIILWAITRELRLLIALANKQQPAGLWQQRLQSLQQCLQRQSLTQLYTYVQCAAHIDAMIKGAVKGNVWDELTQLGSAISSPLQRTITLQGER